MELASGAGDEYGGDSEGGAAMRHVWVIEMRVRNGTVWHVVDAEPNLRVARGSFQIWQQNDPDDDFRVVRYVPVTGATTGREGRR